MESNTYTLRVVPVAIYKRDADGRIVAFHGVEEATEDAIMFTVPDDQFSAVLAAAENQCCEYIDVPSTAVLRRQPWSYGDDE